MNVTVPALPGLTLLPATVAVKVTDSRYVLGLLPALWLSVVVVPCCAELYAAVTVCPVPFPFTQVVAPETDPLNQVTLYPATFGAMNWTDVLLVSLLTKPPDGRWPEVSKSPSQLLFL